MRLIHKHTLMGRIEQRNRAFPVIEMLEKDYRITHLYSKQKRAVIYYH